MLCDVACIYVFLLKMTYLQFSNAYDIMTYAKLVTSLHANARPPNQPHCDRNAFWLLLGDKVRLKVLVTCFYYFQVFRILPKKAAY